MRVKTHPSSPHKQVQICHSFREEGKSRQKVIRHIGTARNENELQELKNLAATIKAQIELENQLSFSKLIVEEPQESNQVNLFALKEKGRHIEGFHDIFGKIFSQAGFNDILPKSQSEVLLDVLLARIAAPCSKSKTQKILSGEFGKDISLDRIYRMMDALIANKDKIQRKIFETTQNICNKEVDVLLFDVTTLYFESVEEDELRDFGFSKDQKFHMTQVVLALATTKEGLPLGYRLFPGDTAEVSTLISSLQDWRRTLPIDRVIFVADRAMMSESNLALLEEAKINYVVAAKLKKMKGNIQTKILEGPKQKEETDKAYQDMLLANGRRLIISHSMRREEKDKKDRERGLKRVQKKLGKGKSLKRLIPNYGYQKYIKIEGDGKVKLDEEKVKSEEGWDGFHGVITNCLETQVDELLSHYRRLWVIEESFRIQKHTLRIRPIYHFKPERIEAHILLCYMAFSLMRYLEYEIKKFEMGLSMEEVRTALWSVQVSLLHEGGTENWYRMPSNFSEEARKIYQIIGVKRSINMKKM
ncbi:MAG: IS1634 family transposase [Chlamydiales bacterium]